ISVECDSRWPPHCGRAAQADRTAVMRTHFTAWYLPCGRGQSDVALALYGRVLHGLSRGPPCPAPSPANRCGDVPIGSGSRREVGFVQKKANKPWMWIAMDATTRQ